MVNYHDPTTVAQEYCAYDFPSGFELQGWQPNLLLGFFDSGAHEALARHVWYIYVSPHVLVLC
jgi:hypothetical protein